MPKARLLRSTLIASSVILVATSFAIAAASATAAPSRIVKTVNSLAGSDNKTIELTVGMEGGKAVYDLEFVQKGTNYGAEIDAEGNILIREVEVDATVVPPAVVAAAQKAHPDGKITEYAIVTAADSIYYGVDVTVGKELHSLEIQPSGRLIKDSVEGPEAPVEMPNTAPKAAVKSTPVK